jgi:hypothetical protein
MKVTEIIMSNSIQESTIGDAWRVLRGTAKVAEPEVAQAAKTAGKTMADLPVSARNTAKTAEKPKASWLDNAADKANAAKIAKAEKIIAQEKLAVVSAHYGTEAVSWLSKVNLLEAAAEYWWKSSELDKQLAAGKIDQQTYDQEIIKLRGLAITQWIAPKIGAWVANKAAAITLVKHLPWVIRKLGMPNAGAIIKDFAKPAVQAAIIAFIMTPAGKKWLMDTCGAFVIGVGSIPTLASKIWDVVQGVYDAAVYGDKEDDSETPNSATGGNDEVDDVSTPADKTAKPTPKKSMPYDMSTRELN